LLRQDQPSQNPPFQENPQVKDSSNVSTQPPQAPTEITPQELGQPYHESAQASSRPTTRVMVVQPQAPQVHQIIKFSNQTWNVDEVITQEVDFI
jgi:hypothetical protein